MSMALFHSALVACQHANHSYAHVSRLAFTQQSHNLTASTRPVVHQSVVREFVRQLCKTQIDLELFD